MDEGIDQLTKAYTTLYPYSSDWINLPSPCQERQLKQGQDFKSLIEKSIKMTETISSELDFQKMENTCRGIVTLIEMLQPY